MEKLDFVIKTDLIPHNMHSDIDEAVSLKAKELLYYSSLKDKKEQEVVKAKDDIKLFYHHSGYIVDCLSGTSMLKINIQDGTAKRVKYGRVGNHLITKVVWADNKARYMAFLNHFHKKKSSPDIYYLTGTKVLEIFQGTNSKNKNDIFNIKGKTLQTIPYVRSKRAEKWKKALDKKAKESF